MFAYQHFVLLVLWVTQKLFVNFTINLIHHDIDIRNTKQRLKVLGRNTPASIVETFSFKKCPTYIKPANSSCLFVW